MEKVRPWCGQPSDRGRLKNKIEQNHIVVKSKQSWDKMECNAAAFLCRLHANTDTYPCPCYMLPFLSYSGSFFIDFPEPEASSMSFDQHGAVAQGTKVCRYNWHSAGSLCWPFPMLKYEYIFQIKYTEAISSNSTRILLRFEITKMLIAVKTNLLCYLL